MIMKIVQFTSKKSWSKMINFQKEDLRYLKNSQTEKAFKWYSCYQTCHFKIYVCTLQSLEWMLICEHDNIIGNNQMRI